MDVAGIVAEGRAAAEAARWEEAYDALRRADELGGLDVDGLESLALAALFNADPQTLISARQRQFAQLRGVDHARAAHVALLLGLVHLGQGSFPVADGWLTQGRNLIADAGECDATAWLAWIDVMLLSETGQAEAALAAIDGALAVARRLGNDDVAALVTLLHGQLLTAQGDVAAGAKLIDPVMALAVAGCLDPFVAGWVYCGTISTCASTGDFRRAWEWTNEVGRCSVTGQSDFPGDCRIHRAEILRIRGDWAKAEVEAASACDRLRGWHPAHAAAALYELGELSLQRGDLEGAAAAFAQCQVGGHHGQPGAALLDLASGRTEDAVTALTETLAATAQPFARSHLLPAAVQALLAVGRSDEAEILAGELKRIAATSPAPVHRGRALTAIGEVMLARGDRAGAQHALADAAAAWRDVSSPYEEAKAVLLLGLAEDGPAKTTHLRAARDAFARLGATLDRARADHYLGEQPVAERVTRAFMFTDIEGSTAMLASLGDDAWLPLLRHHDTTLRQLFASFLGEELTGTGDGFFVGFPTADAAIDCAAAIQGSALDVRVRIGIHLAEANKDATGYSGRGVHEAARICALGDGGDVVVSATTLSRASTPYPVRERRLVELKGLPGEVEVAFVEVAPAGLPG